MTDDIPAADVEFNAWQTNFLDYASANAVELGLDAADLAALETAQTKWETEFPAHVTAVVAAESAPSDRD